MSDLPQQLKALEAALPRLRRGDPTAFYDVTVILEKLRETAIALEQRQAELLTLYEVGREIASIIDLRQLLESIMDRAVVLVQAERGFLVLWDEQRNDFEVAVARQFSAGEVDQAQVEISHNIIRRVMSTREALMTTNAQEDPRFQSSTSIVAYSIRSVMAVPLIAKDELIGAIYVDTRLKARMYSREDLNLLSALADQAAVAIRMARLYEELQQRNRELQATLDELRATQDELIRAERLSVVGRMASSIIHDLKNPMTSIKGFAQLLGQDDLSPEQRRRFSDTISHAVDRFVGMTQEILDYVRGDTSLRLEEVPADELVNAVCAFVEPEFAAKGLSIQTNLEFTGPILVDPDKFQRVFLNIANNARDAMPVGGVLTITSRRVDNYVEFRWRDTGPGIPPEIVDRLFEPFVTYGKPSGTGLGLAIVKKVVEDHGGTVQVENHPGEGACFVITIPLNR
ncbi:MAG: GAF domain-containing sensor histidine kinase [Anaerolineae bacterium]|nr:GAF domain-containing sensor histidine kinase [Anaerolineae bacterium]